MSRGGPIMAAKEGVIPSTYTINLSTLASMAASHCALLSITSGVIFTRGILSCATFSKAEHRLFRLHQHPKTAARNPVLFNVLLGVCLRQWCSSGRPLASERVVAPETVMPISVRPSLCTAFGSRGLSNHVEICYGMARSAQGLPRPVGELVGIRKCADFEHRRLLFRFK